MEILLEHNALRIGPRFAVKFERTLRVPDDGATYPLPPGLGSFPIFRVADYADRLPSSWREHDGFFIPMYQREALWLAFHGARWKPNAVMISLGRVNAISGRADDAELGSAPQNYLVSPQQPWLDGINSGAASVRQFVAMPLGQGATVEAALMGGEEIGGLRITVFEPKPAVFPDEPPPDDAPIRAGMPAMAAVAPMGLGAGGKLRQKIYPDPFGIETWDPTRFGGAHVHLLNSAQFRQVTGRDAPPPPVDAATYAKHGLPWFDLYDEQQGDVPAPPSLAGVKTVAERDAELGRPSAEEPLDPRTLRVTKLRNEPAAPEAGATSLSRKPHSSERE